MSDKRFIVESVMIDCLCEDEPRIAKVITDTDENYSYEDLYEVAELLNEQQATIQSLKEENEQLKSLVNACEYGQKSLMKEMKHNDEALDKIWEIMKELYGVIDDE